MKFNLSISGSAYGEKDVTFFDSDFDIREPEMDFNEIVEALLPFIGYSVKDIIDGALSEESNYCKIEESRNVKDSVCYILHDVSDDNDMWIFSVITKITKL